VSPVRRLDIQRAVMRERTRCARVIERTIEHLGGAAGPPEDDATGRALWAVLCERLDNIKRPWATRPPANDPTVARLLPRRRQRSCGICGAEDHTAPKHNFALRGNVS
jgi:hypothetical protein